MGRSCREEGRLPTARLDLLHFSILERGQGGDMEGSTSPLNYFKIHLLRNKSDLLFNNVLDDTQGVVGGGGGVPTPSLPSLI